jgi:hypothetical protein
MKCCTDGIQFSSYANREVIKEIVCENGVFCGQCRPY